MLAKSNLYRPSIVLHTVEIMSSLVVNMNWSPLRQGIISDDFITKIFDIFDSVPSFIQVSMLQLVRDWIDTGWNELCKYLIDTKALVKIIKTIVNLQQRQNMIFSTCWSIIKTITRHENKMLASYICEWFSKEVNTMALSRVFCPLMRMTSKWSVLDYKQRHLCTFSTDKVSEVKNEEMKETRHFDSNAVKTSIQRESRLSDQEVRSRLSLIGKVERERETSSENRRNRVRSKALGVESEFYIGSREYRENATKIELNKRINENDSLQSRFLHAYPVY
jgi:hypothetical protein